MASSPHVIDVSEASFEADVVHYSMQAPVLIDFWAAWCGPCKTLGPMLEELADEFGGAFRLAKVDVDRNQQLAMAFRAQSIPTVVAVYQGQFVDQFVGALPKAQLKQFLERVFERAGLPMPTLEPPVPTDPAKARAHWQGQIDKDAQNWRAHLELGRLLLTAGEDDEAEALLKKIPAAADEYNDARAALQLKSLLAQVAEAGGEAAVRQRAGSNPDDAQAAYLVACADGARGKFADALEVLVGLVGSGPKELRDDAKAAAAVVFDVAGRGDEAVEKLRRRLARLLF